MEGLMHGDLAHPAQVFLRFHWHVHQELLVFLAHVVQGVVGEQVPRGKKLLLDLPSRLNSLLDVGVLKGKFPPHLFLPLDLLV